MKRIQDMKDEELLALKEEDIERAIKLEMAEEGVPLYPEPDEPKYITAEPPKREFFTFEKVFNCVLFPDADGLRNIVNMMKDMGCKRKVKEYTDPASHYEDNIMHSPYHGNEFEISSEKLYDKDSYKDLKVVLEENKKRRLGYEDEVKTVRETIATAREIRDSVWGPIREAETRDCQCKRAASQFLEYMDIADGNAKQAWKFFEKANNPEEHVEVFLRKLYKIPANPTCEDLEEKSEVDSCNF